MTNESHAHLALTLSFEFQKYLMQHADVADQIPAGAIVVFQLENNPEFNSWSRTLAGKQKASGQKTVTVRLGEMSPPVSRIEKVELLAS